MAEQRSPFAVRGEQASLARAADALRDGRLGEASGICQDILRHADLAAPLQIEARRLRDEAAGQLGGLAHAIFLLEWSVRANPGNPVWLGILVELYRRADRFDDALAVAGEIVGLQPDQAPPQLTLARVHADRGEIPPAIAAFLAALALEPANAVAHFGLAQLLLLQGDYRAGWVEYEWRHRLDPARAPPPPLRRPQWNGMQLKPGHLLLHHDQGFGDAFQFARFIPHAASRVGQLSLLCAPPCRELFTSIAGDVQVTDDWKTLGEVTAQTTLASLPGLFDTTLASIPDNVPYLSADPARVAMWRSRLAGRLPDAALRVGISWAGNQAPPGDPRRAVPCRALAPLAAIAGVAFVSLQKDQLPGDADALRAFPDLLDLGPHLVDFAETAAVLKNLDLVISICSGLTHLAGALGRPVWVMLCQQADWRWLRGREDSPWYPTARLFRQPRTSDWPSVVAAVAGELTALVGAGSSHEQAGSRARQDGG